MTGAVGSSVVSTSFRFDPVTLCEVPDDVPAARARLAALAAGPDRDDPAVLAERVPLARMLGDLDEAERLGAAALRLAGGPADPAAAVETGADDLPRAAVGPLLRYAHVLQWQERFDEADLLFGLALEAARHHGTRGLEAFALQHWGKCRYDRALSVHADDARPYLDEALALFERAHALRTAPGEDPGLAASSALAAAAARDRLAEL